MDPWTADRQPPGSVSLDSIKPWHEDSARIEGFDGEKTGIFPFSDNINKKIYTWSGDITKLCVQAVILPLHEVMCSVSPLRMQLYNSAGCWLLKDCQRLKKLQTGEVRVLQGYDMPARHVVFSAEPKFNARYTSAANTALHICYRSALQVAAENGFRCIAISPLHITRKGFPISEGSDVALRTIRKSLEILYNKFDAVVIATDPLVVSEYLRLLPLYFPRSRAEVDGASGYFKKELCFDEWGGILKRDRSIRVTDLDHALSKERRSMSDSAASDKCMSESSISKFKSNDIDKIVPHPTFLQMTSNNDQKRKNQIKHSDSLSAQQRIYDRLLRRAKVEDFSQYHFLQAVYTSGFDVSGNRVVVIVGRKLIFTELDQEKFLLYLIATLDSVVDKPYTIVYFDTDTSEENHPSTDYSRKIYDTLDLRYKTNLVQICLVHMTSILRRFRLWVHAVTSMNEIRGCVVHVKSVPELYKLVAPNQITIPSSILNYDMRANPKDYAKGGALGETTPKSDLNLVSYGSL